METQSLGLLVNLKSIVASKTNPRKRFNQDDLKDLAASIKEHGVMQPILVRPLPGENVESLYEIVAGERRWRATDMAGIDTIPAVIRQLNDLETLQLQIIENLQRSDLHPLEEAQGFKALLDNKDAASWNADQLAAKVGKSKSYIYGSLKLNELCVYAQDMFLDGKFGREIALLIARIPGEKLQTLACKEIVKGHGLEPFSFRAAKSHIHSRYTLSLADAKFDTNCKKLVPDAGACFSCPKRSGNYPELFSDIESADVCTDPDCFASKKAAHIEIVISQHKRVLQGEDAKKVMPYGVNSYIDDRTYSKLGEYDKDPRFNQPYSELLGDDLPEPIILVDDNKNMITLYEKSALAEKLEVKIASGELMLKPKEKSLHQIEREEKEAKQAEENQRRLHIFNRLAPHIGQQHLAEILRMAITEWSRDTSADLEPIAKLYGFEGGSDEEFFTEFLQKNQDPVSLIKMLAMVLIAPGLEVSRWNWNSEADNENDKDYQNLLSFIGNIGLDVSQFLTAELPLTPPIAAQASELVGAEKPDEVADIAAPAEAKKLPPGMQKSKDAFLAKQARKNAKTSKDESANADVLPVPADKAAGTVTEVANA
jgi:ParB/RepB/Spo0J family partition protein